MIPRCRWRDLRDPRFGVVVADDDIRTTVRLIARASVDNSRYEASVVGHVHESTTRSA